jgi:hypothetical protein
MINKLGGARHAIRPLRRGMQFGQTPLRDGMEFGHSNLCLFF